MKKFLITTALILSVTINAQAADVKSNCDTPKSVNQNDIDKALTTAAMIKTFETAKYGDKLSPEEKIACGFILQDTLQKGLIGNRDKVLQLVVNLKEVKDKNAKYKYTYTGKITISDYRKVSDVYKKSFRIEALNGRFELLPQFPPIIPPIIYAPEPIVPPKTPPIILGEPPRVY